MMRWYVYRAVSKQGKALERRFLTKSGARAFADSMLLYVEKYRITREGKRYFTFPAAVVLALVVACSFPAAAVADENSEPSTPLVAGEVDDGGGSGESSDGSGETVSGENVAVEESREQEPQDEGFRFNEQIVGDFFFVMLADTVLLVMVVGALGWISFSTARS